MLLGATGYDAIRHRMYPPEDAVGPDEPPAAPVPPPPPRMPPDFRAEAMPGEDPRNLLYRKAGRAAAERLPFQYEGQPLHPGGMPGRYH